MSMSMRSASRHRRRAGVTIAWQVVAGLAGCVAPSFKVADADAACKLKRYPEAPSKYRNAVAMEGGDPLRTLNAFYALGRRLEFKVVSG